MHTEFMLIGAGVLVGGTVGLTGVGAGSMMTPILILGFGVEPVTAIATDLLFAAFTKIAASLVHFKGKHVDMLVLKRLWIGSIPTCLIVSALVAFGVVPAHQGVILKVLAVLVLISGISMLFAKRMQQIRTESRLAHPEEFKRGQPAWTMACGAALGGTIALTSIGAGALGAAMLRALYPLRMAPIRLVATDTIHAVPIALIAGGVFAQSGKTDWILLQWLLIGSIPAAMLGGRLASLINANKLRTVLAICLILIAAKMLWK